jgi:hypothetical protein
MLRKPDCQISSENKEKGAGLDTVFAAAMFKEFKEPLNKSRLTNSILGEPS